MNKQNTTFPIRSAFARAYMNPQALFELTGAFVAGMIGAIPMVYLEFREHLPLNSLAFSAAFSMLTAVSFFGIYAKDRHGFEELAKHCYVVWLTLMLCAFLVVLLGECGQLLACGGSSAFLIAKLLMFGGNSASDTAAVAASRHSAQRDWGF